MYALNIYSSNQRINILKKKLITEHIKTCQVVNTFLEIIEQKTLSIKTIKLVCGGGGWNKNFGSKL